MEYCIVKVPYKHGVSEYTATFPVYRYGSLSSLVAPKGARIPNAENMFDLNPFFRGENIPENIPLLLKKTIEEDHKQKVDQILGMTIMLERNDNISF